AALFRPTHDLASEPRQLGMAERAAMDMDAPQFGAAVELREDLAGIEEAVGVEGAFQALLLRQIDLIEHRAHEITLLDAHSVLAGPPPADLDAELQNVGAERLGALELARRIGVIEDERVEIAVPSMKDIGDAEPIVLGEAAHAGQHLRQSGARNRAVHAVIV